MLITDRRVSVIGLVDAIGRALDGGVTAVQIREKDLTDDGFLALALPLAARVRDFGKAVIVNGRARLLDRLGADAIHLPSDSPPIPSVRSSLRSDISIGVSVHSVEEGVRRAEEGADYLLLAPIYAPFSKKPGTPPLGPEAIVALRERTPAPIIALGGIDASRAKEVVLAGASGVAVVGSILMAEEPMSAAAALSNALDRAYAVLEGSEPP
jgi:thiamine-phosphate pyrophosphorylase